MGKHSLSRTSKRTPGRENQNPAAKWDNILNVANGVLKLATETVKLINEILHGGL